MQVDPEAGARAVTRQVTRTASQLPVYLNREEKIYSSSNLSATEVRKEKDEKWKREDEGKDSIRYVVLNGIL